MSGKCDELNLKKKNINVPVSNLNQFFEKNRQQQFEILTNNRSDLLDINIILSDIKFNDLFNVQKIVINSEEDSYLSQTNVLLTFSILGFLFGAFLVYNFRIVK